MYYINRKCVDDTSGKEKQLYGMARDLFSLEVIIPFRGLNDNTAVHELLHCIGLPHSFSNVSVSYFDVAFKKDFTDNIMDYSDMHSGIPTIATWEYQWRAIQNSITHLQAGEW